MSSTALPFISIPDDMIHAEGWHVSSSVDGPFDVLEEELQDWDPLGEVFVRREISFDQEAVRAHCRLAEEDVVLLAVQLGSDAGVKRRVHCSEVDGSGETARTLEFSTKGWDLAGRLILRTELVLGSVGASRNVFAAKLPGSRLWSDVWVTEIEGSRSQFPVEAVDFSTLPWIPSENSPWHLHIDSTDLHAPFLASVRLYLNSAHPIAAELDVHDHARSVLEYDIARSLISTVASTEEFSSYSDHFDEGSLGGVVKRMVTTLVHGRSMQEIAEMLRNRPFDFDTEIRAATELFHA